LKDGTFNKKKTPLWNNDAIFFAVADGKVRSFQNMNLASGVERSSIANALNVLMDHTGEVQMNIQPNANGFSLTVQRLLMLAGKPNSLNELQPQLGTNKLPGAAIRSGLVGRLTGLELRMELSCVLMSSCSMICIFVHTPYNQY